MEATVQIGSQVPGRSVSAGLRRIVLSSVIGTAVEWYDFAIYGTATALVFNKLFFPTRGASLSTIVAFATYGVGFLARPVGAAIFGHYGDKIGRKAMLGTAARSLSRSDSRSPKSLISASPAFSQSLTSPAISACRAV